MNELLQNLVLVFLVAGGVLHVFHRLRLPSIVGLLVAGVVIGPHGLGVLRDRADVETLADIGILLLMFSIGLEFTQDRVRELVRAVGLGAAQMVIAIALTAVVALPFVNRGVEAIFLGFLVSHTSSALMLKLFLDRAELDTPPVRLGLGISITQDLSVVLMLLAVPLLAGQAGGGVHELLLMLGRAALVLAVAFVLARWLIPFWLHHVMRSQSRELFLIFLIVVCLGTAWITTLAGLSMALGAFLAGLAIAESEFSHQTLAEVSPFRDLLVSLFFISIGMLLNVGELWSDFGMAAAALIAVLAIKFLSGFVPVLLWGYPLRVATVVGLAIAQIGEFAFVLGHAGHAAGVLTDAHYQQFLLVAIATMIASPFVVASSQPAYLALARVPGLCRLDEQRLPKESEAAAELSGHVIVAGYGLNGRNLAQSLQSLGLPYVVLEMNPTTVHNARQRGEPVYFGDCSRIDVLRKLSLATARGLVLAVSDARATRQAVQAARRENPGLKIVARTRYLSEIDALRQAGADEVVSEEFETSLEVLALTLRLFDVPRSSIDRIVDRIRGDTYSVFRAPASPDNALPMLASLLPGVVFETQTIGPRAAAVGRTLSQIDLRARTGATLLAVRRQADLVTVPTADLMLQANDDVLLAGNPDQVRAAMALLESTATGSTAAVE